MGRLAVILKSKTMWGSVLTAGAWLFGQTHVGPVEIMQAVGGVVTAIGVRDAINIGPKAPDAP